MNSLHLYPVLKYASSLLHLSRRPLILNFHCLISGCLFQPFHRSYDDKRRRFSLQGAFIQEQQSTALTRQGELCVLTSLKTCAPCLQNNLLLYSRVTWISGKRSVASLRAAFMQYLSSLLGNDLKILLFFNVLILLEIKHIKLQNYPAFH